MAESRTFEKCFYPFIVALQSMPKVALAPLIIVWCGYGAASKIVMVALMCFFPLFVNTVVGIRQTDRQLIGMMRSFSAPASLVFFRVKLYAAAGHIFAGLQISIVLALIGAVVAEFVAGTGGNASGLAYRILESSYNLKIPRMFAALFLISATGIAIFLATSWISHRLLHRWHESAIKREL